MDYQYKITNYFTSKYKLFEDDDLEIHQVNLNFTAILTNLLCIFGTLYVFFRYYKSLELYRSDPTTFNFNLLIYFLGGTFGLGLGFAMLYYSDKFYFNARLYISWLKLLFHEKMYPLYISIQLPNYYNISRINVSRVSNLIVPFELAGVNYDQIRPEITRDSRLGYPIFQQIDTTQPITFRIPGYKDIEFTFHNFNENILAGFPFILTVKLKNHSQLDEILVEKHHKNLTQGPSNLILRPLLIPIFFVIIMVILWMIQVL